MGPTIATWESVTEEAGLAGFRLMWLIRRFDERAVELRLAGRIKGPVHPSTGQEAVAAGVCSALRPDDRLATHHRGHGHALAKGADPARMFAELFGAETGYCRGKGGSMHIADQTIGMIGANGIVGAGAPLSVGSALASALRGGDEVTVCFFGDGATGQGQLYEAMNLAVLWKLPVVFVCENNGYASETPVTRGLAAERFADVASAFSMPSSTVDGNDFDEVRRATGHAVVYARTSGPALVECLTFRQGVHCQRDAPVPDRRDADEVARWLASDPIERQERRLRDAEVPDAAIVQIRREVEAELERAIAEAAGAPAPAPATALEDVYAPPPAPFTEPFGVSRTVKTGEAIVTAVADAMRADPSVVFISTEVPAALLAEFGPERVRRGPVSEAAMTGAATGAAMCGLRPVVFLRNANFSFGAFDQLVNQAAKLRYMSGGQYSLPLTVWVIAGAGTNSAAQHSSVPYAMYAHTPGLSVVAPSGPADSYALMRAAIAQDDPVVVVGSYRLASVSEELDPDGRRARIGEGRIARAGRDVTVVAASSMVALALAAAEQADDDGISVEVVDLRTIAPLDAGLVRESVRRTGRLLVVDEAPATCSLSADVAAVVTEDPDTFAALTAPTARVTAEHTPIPYAPELEDAVVPSPGRVLDAVRRLTAGRTPAPDR
jgi:2-oxoisovalerate dehydrogenase E1 component